MQIIKTPVRDLLIIQPRVFGDARGYFFESYNRNKYQELGIEADFCQDNLSRSSYGVIRGIHFQHQPHSQTKLVSVTVGKVWDVAVDLRHDSPTFGQWYGIELSAENKTQFLIPKGFGHGFSVLSEEAVFSYKCDDFYQPQYEAGIRFDDPDLNIDWKIPADKALISDKDLKLPLLKDAIINF